MPTPSSDTHPTPAAATADTGDTLQFRAATLEDAIALAESSLGARVRVVAANRIRRGGIGGFFAADLGVEVTVALDDETMEQALERLVADSAVEERMGFEERLAAQEHAASERAAMPEPVTVTRPEPTTTDPIVLLGGRFDRRDDEPAPTVNPVLADVVAAIVAEAVEKQALVAAAADVPTGEQPVVDAAPSPAAPVRAASPDVAPAAPAAMQPQHLAPQHADPQPSMHEQAQQPPPVRLVAPDLTDEPGTRPVYTTPPTMLKVEQIMAELSAITAEPVFGERSRARVARPAGRTRLADEEQLADQLADHQPGPRADVTSIETSEFGLDDDVAAAAATEVAPKIIPTLPPRPSDVARRASDAAHAARTRFLTNQPPDLFEPAIQTRRTLPTLPDSTRGVTAPASPWPAAPSAASAASSAASLGLTPTQLIRAGSAGSAGSSGVSAVIDASRATDGDPGVVHVEAIIDDLGSDLLADDERDSENAGDLAGAAPSQRQVELAVAATDQLIESLKREDGLKRLSVRVVLRTGDHREVEAEAEWEAS